MSTPELLGYVGSSVVRHLRRQQKYIPRIILCGCPNSPSLTTCSTIIYSEKGLTSSSGCLFRVGQDYRLCPGSRLYTSTQSNNYKSINWNIAYNTILSTVRHIAQWVLHRQNKFRFYACDPNCIGDTLDYAGVTRLCAAQMVWSKRVGIFVPGFHLT